MPKAGIEPARGQAPLDFESSASSSSATSARSMPRAWYPGRLAGRGVRRHNLAPSKGAAQSGLHDGARSERMSSGARQAALMNYRANEEA